MALTKAGYKRETYEDIVARVELKAKELFGQDVNVGGRSFIGMFIRIIAYMLSLVWQDNENIYNSAYRDTAEGKQLDALMPYAGTSRSAATTATGEVVFSGTAGTIIELGTEVSKVDETIYFTIEESVIGADGTAIVPIMSTEPGIIGNADIGAINQIINPIEGLDSVTNTLAVANGFERETDAELRAKAEISVEGLGSGTTASIRTELLKVNGVRAVYVDENFGDGVNQFGTPISAIQAFVLGGQDTAIATAILNKKSAGIRPFGVASAIVQDSAGQDKVIGFTRAVTVPIYVKVTLTKNNEFEATGYDQVIKAIVKYIGGIDTVGNSYNGLNMGDDVVLSKLIAKLYAVNGIDDVDIKLSKTTTGHTASNIAIAQQQVATTSANAIEVT